MRFNYYFSLFAVVLFITISARAEILFEGYYKAYQFKKHIGFLILRHEIDAKTKNFKTTSYIKLAKNGFDMTETYQAESTPELVPVKLNYLAVEGKKTKTIDVKFASLKMTGNVIEDGKKTKIDTTVPNGSFFSSALYYIMLQSKDGLKTDSKFDYVGITEEGPVAANGTVSVEKKMVTQGTTQLLKINNKFVGSDYDNLVNQRGEVISAITPATSIESELVKKPADATEGIKIAKGTLEKIFGNVPKGQINSLQTGK